MITCTCPPYCPSVWDADPNCPAHKDEIAASMETEYQAMEAEIYAENAWLRAAEYDPRMSDPREW